MPRRVAILLGVLIVTVRAATAGDWTYAMSEHFEVYTTSGERTARAVLAQLERVHSFFSDYFKVSLQSGAPTRLIVFSGDVEFRPYRPNELAAAYYQTAPEGDYIVMRAFDDDANQIVFHEYSHLINRHAGLNYPLWLEEGMAVFFSTMASKDDLMLVGDIPLPRLRLLRGVAMMDLSALFAVGQDSKEFNDKAHNGLFYSQSWALTHMFLTDDRYRPGVPALLDLVQKGTASAPAVEQAFGRSLAMIGEDLRAHVRRDRYRGYAIRYKAPHIDEKMPVRTVERFEGDLVTANLLASAPNRVNDARAAFEQLSARKPDDLRLVESRAHFEMQRGDATLAAPHLARAIALGSKTASVYRNYARVSPQNAAELLTKAVSLAPEDAETRLQLASVLYTAGNNGEALAAIAPMKEIAPELAFHYFQILANVYTRMNEVERGRTAAARAVDYAQPGEEAAAAARLLKTIDDFRLRVTLAGGDAGGVRAPADGPDPANIQVRPRAPRGATP